MPKQPNMNQMLQQVQKMQADMMKAQEELKNEVVEASAGGGMVTVKVTGDLEVQEIKIDPDAVDGDEEVPATAPSVMTEEELVERLKGEFGAREVFDEESQES